MQGSVRPVAQIGREDEGRIQAPAPKHMPYGRVVLERVLLACDLSR